MNKLVTMIAMMVMAVGCQTGGKNVVDLKPKLDASSATVKQVATKLPERATKIEEATTGIQTVTQAMPAPQDARSGKAIADAVARVSGFVDSLRTQATGIRADAADLLRVHADLAAVRSDAAAQAQQLADRDDTITEQAKTIGKLEDAAKDRTQRLWTPLIVLSVVGLGVSAVLIGTGEAKAIWLGVGCGVTLIVSVTMAAYGFVIAIYGTGVILIGLTYVGWQIIVKKRAVEELVDTVNVVKAKLTPEARTEVFQTPTASGAQSDTTEAMVAKMTSG